MRNVVIFLRRTHAVAAAMAPMLVLATAVLGAQSQPAKQIESGRSQNPAAAQDKPDAIPPINITVTAPDKSAEEKAAERQRNERQDATNERIAEFTFWLVIVGAGQAVATAFAFWASWRASRTANNNVELIKIQMRPYIEVKHCKLIEGNTYPGELSVQLGIVNSGGTPAGITMIETNYEINVREYVGPRGMTRKSMEGATLSEVFPGADGFPLTIALDRALVPAGAFYMQVYGRIAYLNRVDKRTETVDFGYTVARSDDGQVTYQRAEGMRNTLKWAHAAQRDPSIKNSPDFLIGDPDLTLGSRRGQRDKN